MHKKIYNSRMDEELMRLSRSYNKQTCLNVIKNRKCEVEPCASNCD